MNAARVVCLAVSPGEEALLGHTLPALLTNTLAATPLVLAAVGGDRQPLVAAATALKAPPDRLHIRQLDNTAGNPLHSVLTQLPAIYPEYDLLFLRPGMIVPMAWDARLALAAEQDSAIAAASPLCDSAPLFSIVSSRQSRQTPENIDRLVYRLSRRRSFEIPAFLNTCVYLRHAAVAAVAPTLAAAQEQPLADFGWSLAQAFRLAGWHNVLCDHVYVADENPASRRQLALLQDKEDVAAIERVHPLTGLRHAVNDALKQGMSAPAVGGKPVQLHIVHCWGGGLERWVNDYWVADEQRTNLILRSVGVQGWYGQRIALYRSPASTTPIRFWELDYPIRAIAVAHRQYRLILQEIIAEFGIEALVVSSLIGHSLDVLAVDLPTTVVAHDYLPFCPALNIYFQEICQHCDAGRLTRCFAENEHNRFFTNVSTPEWLAIRWRFAALTQRAPIKFAAPSASVARHLTTLQPELAAQTFTIIPHGDNAPAALPKQERPASERLKIVVLGRLTPDKGKALLAAVYPIVKDIVTFYLLGCGEEGAEFDGKPGVEVTPRYEREQLAELIDAIDPDAGLLLSIVPETFSYTLSELFALRIPPIVTRVGSFADRVEDGVNGLLCDPTAAALADKLHWAAANRAALDAIRQRLATRERRTLAAMVADYHALSPLPAFSARRYLTARQDTGGDDQATAQRAVIIDPRVRFSVVLQEFGRYTLDKLQASPRLGRGPKRLLGVVLKAGLRLLGASPASK